MAATHPGCFDSSCSQIGPFPLAKSGLLAPGSYVLEVVATGNAAPLNFNGNFFPLSSLGDYSVSLSWAVPVPALSRAGAAGLAACLVLVSLPVLLRARRARS